LQTTELDMVGPMNQKLFCSMNQIRDDNNAINVDQLGGVQDSGL